ncbi:cytochrome P450 [Streptomyces sp. NBC_00047]|uniref:cytochrome P450 n=1 Tax=Streptomyces sp. NBC_00047 TaxID=2975627 RepID=UPI00225C3C57|nr:cytochrome P450 [Streptomyces sp. NBC_00047]MCX5610953.1 cytochrome P450 [Streptomyces sp. NBC_00047]
MDQNSQSPHECPVPFHGGLVPLHGGLPDQDPGRFYEGLRRHWGPIAPVELGPGVGAWLVMGYQEVLELVWNERAFSSDARRWNSITEGSLPEDSPLLAVLGWRPALNRLDDQAHRRQRRAVTETLNGIDLRRLRSTVRQQAEALVDGWATDRTADLVSQYARPLVWSAFRMLVGLPRSEERRLGALLGSIAGGAHDAARAEAELTGMLHRLVAAKREVPGPDLTSWLLAHSAPLTEAEVAHGLAAVLLSGGESTIGWISGTMRLLLGDARLDSAVATGQLTVRDLTDRALWDGSPVPNIAGRWARNDLTFAGCRVRAGDLLIPCLAAANTDLRVHGAQNLGSRAHLAWGTGSHGCPAKDVARSIAETAVDVLLRRLGQLRPGVHATAPPRQPSLWSGAPDELPVVFAPVRPVRPNAAAGAPATSTVMGVPAKRKDERAADSGSKPPQWSWWNSINGW